MNHPPQQRETLEASVTEISLQLLRSFLSQDHHDNDPFACQVAVPPLQQYFTLYPTQPNLLKNSLSWFDTLNLSPLPPRLLLECKTMLGEAVDNVRDHAHKGLANSTLIPIVLTLFPEVISVQIWDQGPGFDLVNHLKSKEIWPDSDASRGRGLKILAELSDRVGYVQHQNMGNCLILLKKY
ncbi:MAG: ATP-binding protein [Prochlorotrichaceae cyanobacterium]|jgi:anti-sigma regulatory factor (Ser/Thr protein kinase)